MKVTNSHQFKQPTCTMAERRSSITNNFLSAFILTITFWTNIQSSMEHGLTTDYSGRYLVAIPNNIPAHRTVLDLSHNNISELQISDFRSLSKLQTLLLSYNLIRVLNLSVFQYNKDLQHLDVSHNNLQTLSCYPISSLRHLDLSYNNYAAMLLCTKFGKMLNLEYLGLSIRRMQKSDFSVLAHLQLDTLFLGLEDLSEYSSGNLPVFNAKSLQIALPQNTDLHVLLDLELSATKRLQLSKIQEKHINDLRTFLSNLNKHSTLRNLTLNNMQCNWDGFIDILQSVWESTTEYFVISNVPPLEVPNTMHFNQTATSIKALAIKQIPFTTFLSAPTNMYEMFANMNIAALTISDAGLIHMLCPSKFSNFTYLCFSNNSLTDTVFKKCNNLTLLETLILQSNQFKDLTEVSLMTTLMNSLKYLDMSKNLLWYNGNKCEWGENVVKLNLSSNVLSESVFRCLPVNIQMLDLQDNQISSVPMEIIELNYLEELNLASNKLTALPGCGHFRGLKLLNIENNSVLSQSSEFFQSCQNINILKGGHNPFMCSCELRRFINLEKQGSIELIGWPDFYVCEYPHHLKGTLLRDFHVSELVCNVKLLITVVLIITVVFLLAVSFVCIYFDIPWYLKTMWHWSQAKHRIWKSKPEDMLDSIQFHAFISYSEHDSDWVKNVLIPNLEKEDTSIRICQHERNFIAGKSIVENIIDCIEKSYKSIFVLSPNFVQSDWCHYELYFAHHKLFSGNADSLILILLEPIPSYVIPSRYHKLKALMAKRTYLEWPKEKSKHGLFWANLRAAIQIELPLSDEINEL
ncbi:toll-like receptor 1 [Elgaria multicarinata webbii]|uniref:toll-like receptor 1 n=1 Tax=Elgaria multicarinata webbii TaxID=159646 RepID=UPI002FCD4B26